MSTDTTRPQADAQVIPLRAAEAATESGLAGTPPPAYLDTTTVRLRPIVPVPLRRDNIRGTVAQAAGLGWHRTRYHGLRSPVYLVVYLFHAVKGGFVLGGKLAGWVHWHHGWVLESQAVAAGRAGHQHAMSAHTQRQKTTSGRLKVAGLGLVLGLAAGVAMWAFSPWWGWALTGLILMPVLARHGKPEGKHLIKAAVVAPQYQAPTPEIITRALGSLGISGINEVLRDGRGLTFTADVHRDGPGWATQLDLPHGVTATMVLARREQLASGLRRPLSATWPAPVPQEHPGRLDLWIGFQDASKVRPATWPLLRAGQASVFDPFPFGVSPRQQQVDGTLFEHNWLVGSAPGQGKTGAIRVLACAAALDPFAEIWMHELKGIGDLEQFAPVCHRYTSGLDDESIGYAAESLRVLRAELERRSQEMKKLPREARPEGKITRDLAARRSLRLYPLVAFFDEVQNVMMHPRFGSQAAEDAGHVIRMGRAYGIVLVLSTQRPTSETIPTGITGNVTTRFCLQVPGQVENDTVLGTGAYKNGFSAAAFRPKTDAGTGWLRGENATQVVHAYKLDLPDAARVVERARVMRGRAGTITGYALGQDDRELPRSFAADVLAVFGADGKLYTATIAARLAESIPGVYADVTPAAVTSQLRAVGITVKNVRQAGQAPGQGCERQAVEAVTG